MTVENISIEVKTNAGSAAQQFRSLSSAISSISKSNKAISGVASSAKTATKHTNAFASSLMRIAKYRLLRTALKEVSQAFNEGLKNAYHWSKEFSKSVDNSLAKSLDNLATKSQTMKNQMGAAFGALLQAIAPILLQIISLVTQAMQALSALFAAIGGGQYLVAKDTAAEWDKATGAAKKYKNTILGFDEINRLDDPNSGGGGNTANVADMFKEGELPKWALDIKAKLSPVIDDIKQMFNGLTDFVGGVFTGDLDAAFSGLGKIVSGFGKLVSDVLNGAVVPTVDVFSQKIIEIIDGMLLWIQEKTGIDLTKLRETILFFLNEVRFLIEGYCLKIGWIIEDLGLIAQDVMNGDWESAWEHAQMLVHDAQIDVSAEAALMAKGVTENMIDGKNSTQDFGKAFKDIMIDSRNEMGKTGSKVGDLGKAFDSVITPTANNWSAFSSSIIGGALRQMGVLGSLLDVVLNLTGAYEKLGGTTINSNGFSHYSGKFADGGIPDTGSLFIAGEAGAEIVTNLGNGRTGVTNVEQMKGAVREGNLELLNTVQGGINIIVKAINEIDPDIQLDGQSLADKMYHYNKQAANRHGTAMVSMA